MSYAVDLENEPTLAEDMARFPDQTEREVKCARKHWIAGTVEICDSRTMNKLNVSKIALCSSSSVFTKSLSLPRCWPYLDLQVLLREQGVSPAMEHWHAFKIYIEFFYDNDVRIKSCDTLEWMALLGETFKDPEFFNFSMNHYFSSHGRSLGTNDERKIIQVTIGRGVISEEDVQTAYNQQILIKYLIDKIAWETSHMRPDPRIQAINHHIEKFISDRKVEARANPQMYGPFEEPNRHKYLMPEAKYGFQLMAIKEMAPVIKREASPDGDRHENVNTNVVVAISGPDVVVKREVEDGVRDESAGPEEGRAPRISARRDVAVKKEEGSDQIKFEPKDLKRKAATLEAGFDLQVVRVQRVEARVPGVVHDLT